MNLEQAKIICNAHVEYVLNNTPNDYTVEEIGIAIDVISDTIKHYSVKHNFILDMYNLWRRGEILDYPNNSTHNMNILKESVLLV